jgi:hypothetical protein
VDGLLEGHVVRLLAGVHPFDEGGYEVEGCNDLSAVSLHEVAVAAALRHVWNLLYGQGRARF